jgi:hypothetical protein
MRLDELRAAPARTLDDRQRHVLMIPTTLWPARTGRRLGVAHRRRPVSQNARRVIATRVAKVPVAGRETIASTPDSETPLVGHTSFAERGEPAPGDRAESARFGREGHARCRAAFARPTGRSPPVIAAMSPRRGPSPPRLPCYSVLPVVAPQAFEPCRSAIRARSRR